MIPSPLISNSFGRRAILAVIAGILQCSQQSRDSDTQTTLLALLASRGTPTSGIVSGGIPIPSGGPAGPGEPLNAPDLNDLVVQTNDFGPLQVTVRLDPITFQQPVHNQTTVTAFVGGRNMRLLPDQTVINSQQNWSLTVGQLGTSTPPAFSDVPGDRKEKLLVVAKNEFGISSKEFPFSHPRRCASALQIPGTAGDCGVGCLQSSATGSNMTLVSKKTVPEGTYLYLEILLWDLNAGSTLLTPITFSEVGDGTTVTTAGQYEVAVTWDTSTYESICAEATYQYSFQGPAPDFEFQFDFQDILVMVP